MAELRRIRNMPPKIPTKIFTYLSAQVFTKISLTPAPRSPPKSSLAPAPNFFGSPRNQLPRPCGWLVLRSPHPVPRPSPSLFLADTEGSRHVPEVLLLLLLLFLLRLILCEIGVPLESDSRNPSSPRSIPSSVISLLECFAGVIFWKAVLGPERVPRSRQYGRGLGFSPFQPSQVLVKLIPLLRHFGPSSSLVVGPGPFILASV